MGVADKIDGWFRLWINQFKIGNIQNKRCNDNEFVLIIKLDAIGDFIIWLDSAKEYKKIFPDKSIVLLCDVKCKDLASVYECFDEIITLDIKKFEKDTDYRNTVIIENGKRQYGLLIQTAYSRTQHMDMLSASIPAKVKIAFEADESKSNVSRSVVTTKNKLRLDSIYDKLIPSSKANLMELQRNKEFIHGLGHKNFKSSIPALPKIEGVKIPQMEYFLVFPGASTKMKTWRLERYAKVINYINKKTAWTCLVCGSSSENTLFELMETYIDDKSRFVNYCGKTTLIELIETVRNAKIVISNDTSGIHFAAATGVTAICPLGEYNYGRFLPYKADRGVSTVCVCSANMRCRGCASGTMSLRCIVHILRTGKYLCVDKISADSFIKEVAACLERDLNENYN